MDKYPHQMSHAALVYQIKKSRGINWTHCEKEYLMTLCRQRVGIIEDKKSDLGTLGKKSSAWKYIHNHFCAKFGRKRTPIRIKEQWKRMKIAARAELRDRGVLPQNGVIPVDPNLPSTKYYGESLDIISQVQDILFNKNAKQPLDSPNLIDLVETDDPDVQIIIKEEPTDDLPEVHTSHNSFGPDTLMVEQHEPYQHTNENMFVMDSRNEQCYSSYQTEAMNQQTNTNSSTSNQYLSPNLREFNGHTSPCSVREISKLSAENRRSNREIDTSIHQQPMRMNSNCAIDNTNHQQPIRMNSNCAIDNTNHHQPIGMNSNCVIDNTNNHQPIGIEIGNETDNSKHQQPIRMNINTETNNTNKQQPIRIKKTDEIVFEYARIEHNRKMEIMEEEHAMQMEILKMQREIASAKLRKATLKLNILS